MFCIPNSNILTNSHFCITPGCQGSSLSNKNMAKMFVDLPLCAVLSLILSNMTLR